MYLQYIEHLFLFYYSMKYFTFKFNDRCINNKTFCTFRNGEKLSENYKWVLVLTYIAAIVWMCYDQNI